MSRKESKIGRKYGWHPDLPDARDKKFKKVSFIKAISLPSSVDLRPNSPSVYDQGQEGSCTGNGNAYGHHFEQMKQKLADVFMPSRQFIYYNERVIEGTVNQDSGAQIRDGIKTLASQGVCPETMWPYEMSNMTTKPSQDCYNVALKHKIASYESLDNTNINQLKQCLADGYPFIFGFTVYESFESEDVASTGNVPMPGPNESVLGGHCVCGVGYDDATECFLIRNSWGEGWGQCFSGDTKVSLLNGKEVEIQELEKESRQGKAFWVYAYNHKEDKIVPRMAKASMTGIRSDMIEVELDNGKKVLCTRDHKWMLRNGEYLEARYLKRGDSLMPLYRKNDGGYERILSSKTMKWITSHWSFVRSLGIRSKEGHLDDCKDDKCKLIIHHKDYNGMNNSPENLEVMFTCRHQKLHSVKTPETIQKLKDNWRINYDKRIINSKMAINKYNNDVKIGLVSLTDKQINTRKENGKKVGKFPQGEKTIKQIDASRKNAHIMGKLPKTEKQIESARSLCKKLGKFVMHNRWHVKRGIKNPNCELCNSPVNHKVITTREINEEMPVYDITVDGEDCHNFALSAGVFVHNCGYCWMPYAYITSADLASDFWTIRLVNDNVSTNNTSSTPWWKKIFSWL